MHQVRGKDVNGIRRESIIVELIIANISRINGRVSLNLYQNPLVG